MNGVHRLLTPGLAAVLTRCQVFTIMVTCRKLCREVAYSW